MSIQVYIYVHICNKSSLIGKIRHENIDFHKVFMFIVHTGTLTCSHKVTFCLLLSQVLASF